MTAAGASPPGSNNPTVVDEFMGELSSSELQVRHGGYTHFERPAVPSTCTYGGVYLPLHQLQRRAGKCRPHLSKMMLTGYRDHFVKIRIDWLQKAARPADAARSEGFVPALMPGR